MLEGQRPRFRVEPEERPISSQAKFFKVRRPHPGAAVRCIILGRRMYKFWVHNVDGHDQPCVRNEGMCPHCANHWRLGLKGYVDAWDPYKGEMVLAELSPNAIRSCPRLEDRSASLRGEYLVIERKGNKKNGPCTATLLPWPNGLMELHKKQLPQGFDVEMALYRVWRMLVESHVDLNFGNDGLGEVPPLVP